MNAPLPPASGSRRDVYYWKCDRPAALHGTAARAGAGDLEPVLREQLRQHFGASQVSLEPGRGQGNHLTWDADVDGRAMFLRVEDGPEGDGHLAVESAILDRVREQGVPTPLVYGCDASRTRAPFAWQALERIASPDLNHWLKLGRLDQETISRGIGAAVARWQAIRPPGFGPLDLQGGGCHPAYADYFHLRLEAHLSFLRERGFLASGQAADIRSAVEEHRALLDLERGCLVHKDLALWNILGGPDRIEAFIDFDDAISGEPMEDLSLLACFHDADFLARALEGYQSIRPLPSDPARRFWLHLLRNMLVKAVIRVGAGYFERDAGFFLIPGGGSGADLRAFTRERLGLAMRGLSRGLDLDGW